MQENRFYLSQIQINLFFEDLKKRPDIVGESINELLGSIFTEMPVILPDQAGIPENIPLVTYRQRTSFDCQLQLSKSTLHFSIGRKIDNIDEQNSSQAIITEFLKYCDIILIKSNLFFSRVGLSGSFIKEDEFADEKILNSILGIKSKNIKKPKGIQNNTLADLHFTANAIGSFEKRNINNLITIFKSNKIKNKKKCQDINYLLDINTSPEYALLENSFIQSFIHKKIELFFENEFNDTVVL